MTKMGRNKKFEKHMGSFAIIAVVIFMIVFVLIASVKLSAQNAAKEARIQELEEEIAEEEERAAEIDEYRKYVQTKKYVEQVAKEKLGLVYEDEIIFKAEE